MSEIEVLDNGAEISAKQAEKIAAQIENASEFSVKTEETQVSPAILSSEDFEKHFFELFDIIGDLWNMPEFKIQNDKPFEVVGAKVSSAKLYNMAQKYKMLHFLIEPAGGWFGDMVAVSCFVGAKANIVCKKYTGNGLTGYLRQFMKKSGEQVKNNSFVSKFFKKGNENVSN